MLNARETRTKFNNVWPAKFLFPTEESVTQRLAKHNLASVFLPIQIKHSDNHDFQTLLSHCIDSLDYLPLRPDFSFDQVWKALDAEFFRVKAIPGTPVNQSRFSALSLHVSTSSFTSKSHHDLAAHIPLQTCEFFAKRILDSTSNPNEHSEAFTKRVKSTLGAGLLTDIHNKYDSGWLTPSKRAETQRRLGGLLKIIISGRQVTVGANAYQLSADEVSQLMISTILPQFRNERFHGSVRPPFRSSKATLKTYTHAYFLFIYAYSLMCEVFLYRQFGVTQPADVLASTNKNLDRFLKVFGDQLLA